MTQLFDIGGAVEYLKSIGASGATVCFIRGLVSSGQVPHVRIGKKFYVSREALQGWLERHEKRARP
jgi:excisionase family DNA binding protein